MSEETNDPGAVKDQLPLDFIKDRPLATPEWKAIIANGLEQVGWTRKARIVWQYGLDQWKVEDYRARLLRAANHEKCGPVKEKGYRELADLLSQVVFEEEE